MKQNSSQKVEGSDNDREMEEGSIDQSSQDQVTFENVQHMKQMMEGQLSGVKTAKIVPISMTDQFSQEQDYERSPLRLQDLQPQRIQTSVPQNQRFNMRGQQAQHYTSHPGHPIHQNDNEEEVKHHREDFNIHEMRSSDASIDYQTVTTMQHVNMGANILEKHHNHNRRNYLSRFENHTNESVNFDQVTMKTEEPNFLRIGRPQDNQKTSDRVFSPPVYSNMESNQSDYNFRASSGLQHTNMLSQDRTAQPQILMTFNSAQGSVDEDHSRQHTPNIGQDSNLQMNNEADGDFTLGKQSQEDMMQTSNFQVMPPVSIFDLQNTQVQPLIIGTFRPNTISNHTIAEESKESLEALPSIEKERLQSRKLLPNRSSQILKSISKKQKLTASRKQFELQKVLDKYSHVGGSGSNEVPKQAFFGGDFSEQQTDRLNFTGDQMQAIFNQVSSSNNTPVEESYEQTLKRRKVHIQAPQIMDQLQIQKREREAKAQAGLKEVSTEAYLEFQEFLEQGRKSQNFKKQSPKANNYNGSGGGAYTFRATQSTARQNKSTMQTARSKNNKKQKHHSSVIEKLKMHQKQVAAAHELNISQFEHFKSIYTKAKTKRIADYFQQSDYQPSPNVSIQQPYDRQTDWNLEQNQWGYFEDQRPSPRIAGNNFIQEQDFTLADYNQQIPRTKDPRFEPGFVSNTQGSKRPDKYFKNQLHEAVQGGIIRDTMTPFSEDPNALSRPWSIPSNTMRPIKEERKGSIDSNETPQQPHIPISYMPQPMFQHDRQRVANKINQRIIRRSMQSRDLLESARQTFIKENSDIANHISEGGTREGSYLSSFDHNQQIYPQQKTTSPFQKYPANHQQQTPLINVNQTFQFVQQFNNTPLNHSPQRDLDENAPRGFRGQYKSNGSKWSEVVNYVKKNPKVLKQLINLMDGGEEEKVSSMQQHRSNPPQKKNMRTFDRSREEQSPQQQQQMKNLSGDRFFQKRKTAGGRISPRSISEMVKNSLVPKNNNTGGELVAPKFLSKIQTHNRYQTQDRKKDFGGNFGSLNSGNSSINQSKSPISREIRPGGIKNHSQNNFINKQSSVVTGGAQSNITQLQQNSDNQTQMTIYENFINRKYTELCDKLTARKSQVIVLNTSANQKSPQSHQKKGSHQHAISLPGRASTQIKKMEGSGGVKLRNSSKMSNQLEQVIRGSKQFKNGAKKETSLKPIINLNLSGTQKEPLKNVANYHNSIKGNQKTPAFTTDTFPKLKSKMEATETVQTNSQPQRDKSTTENLEDDGFIYEDNDAGESDSLFKHKIPKDAEDDKTILEVNPVDTNQTIDKEQLTSVAINSIVSKDFNSHPVVMDSPRAVITMANDTLELNSVGDTGKHHDNTPFVSQPLLKDRIVVNTDIKQDSITIPQNIHEASKDETDEIFRMKMELEKKDRELKEAHRLIEEIKKNSKKGGDIAQKVYYETPRSRESIRNIRGLSGEKVTGSQMRCDTPKSESPALRKSHNNAALTPKQDVHVNENENIFEQDELNGTRVSKQLQILHEDKSSSALNQTFQLPYSDHDELSSQQPSQQFSYLNSAQKAKKQTISFDWFNSTLMSDVLRNNPHFNSEGDPRFFKESEISYVIEMFNTNLKEIHRAKMVEPFHQKACETLTSVMSEMNLVSQCQRLLHLYRDVQVNNTLRLIEKCKTMLEGRRLIYQVLKDLELQQEMISDLRKVVDINLTDSVDEETLNKIRELAFKIPPVTQSIKKNILNLRDEYKLFSRIAAMSSKTKAVISNVFIFKKKDALRQALQEYENVRNLVTVFDINDLPYMGVIDHTSQSLNRYKVSDSSMMQMSSASGRANQVSQGII